MVIDRQSFNRKIRAQDPQLCLNYYNHPCFLTPSGGYFLVQYKPDTTLDGAESMVLDRIRFPGYKEKIPSLVDWTLSEMASNPFDSLLG